MQKKIACWKANREKVITHNNRFSNRLLEEIPEGLSQSAFPVTSKNYHQKQSEHEWNHTPKSITLCSVQYIASAQSKRSKREEGECIYFFVKIKQERERTKWKLLKSNSFFKKVLIILAVRALCCWAGTFRSCSEKEVLSSCGAAAVASLAGEHGALGHHGLWQGHGLGRCRCQTPERMHSRDAWA